MGILKEGDQIGKYLIEKRVAQGGMGWLYKAVHTTLKLPVAVKMLLPHHAEDPELRGRFLNEARIQCQLRHPYIVQVTDTIEVEGALGIVMEWVEGGDLLAYAKANRTLLPFRHITSLMAPIFDALQYAHDKGIIHRDIKPDNILLQLDGRLIPKLSDFGLAKAEQGLSKNFTKEGDALGSIRYMSPEQIRNTKRVDHRADIYSLGIVLFWLFTGEFPFMGRPEELLFSHIAEPPPRPQELNPQISFQLEDILLCCLQKDPENRFQSCRELSRALLEAAVEFPVEQPQGGSPSLPLSPMHAEATASRRAEEENRSARPLASEPTASMRSTSPAFSGEETYSSEGSTLTPRPSPALPVRSPAAPPSPAMPQPFLDDDDDDVTRFDGGIDKTTLLRRREEAHATPVMLPAVPPKVPASSSPTGPAPPPLLPKVPPKVPAAVSPPAPAAAPTPPQGFSSDAPVDLGKTAQHLMPGPRKIVWTDLDQLHDDDDDDETVIG